MLGIVYKRFRSKYLSKIKTAVLIDNVCRVIDLQVSDHLPCIERLVIRSLSNQFTIIYL